MILLFNSLHVCPISLLLIVIYVSGNILKFFYSCFICLCVFLANALLLKKQSPTTMPITLIYSTCFELSGNSFTSNDGRNLSTFPNVILLQE